MHSMSCQQSLMPKEDFWDTGSVYIINMQPQFQFVCLDISVCDGPDGLQW